MLTRNPRLLVVDTDVAVSASASDPGASPSLERCYLCLEAILTICHRAVLTPSALEEWDRHESVYMRTWITRMARKGKAPPVTAEADDRLRGLTEAVAKGEAEYDEMVKDWHLVEAALCTDMTVISCDGKARSRFARVAARYAKLGRMVWVDPASIEPEELTAWLESGAKARPEWRLRQPKP